MFLIVLLKIFTCWWKFLFKNINFQSIWCIAVVIAFTSDFLKELSSHMEEGIHSEDWVCNMLSDDENFYVELDEKYHQLLNLVDQ